MSEAIRIDGASVRAAGRSLVGPVSFAAEAREITCLVGPNGSGKTSLLRAIAGLTDYHGLIHIAGSEGRALSLSERARLLSYVPQRSLLEAPLSVTNVVAQGRFSRGDSASRSTVVGQSLHRVGMQRHAQRAFTELSLGEQRRVLIARALASQAPCLLLDEPDAYLDVGERLRLFDLLRRLRQDGHTLLVVVHALDQALQNADRCAVLDQGSLAACGPPDQALDSATLDRVFGVRLEHDQAPRFTLTSDGRR